MATLTMVRTACCEGYKQYGYRCSMCPNRPENKAAVLAYQKDSVPGLGCNLAHCEQGIRHPSANLALRNPAVLAADSSTF